LKALGFLDFSLLLAVEKIKNPIKKNNSSNFLGSSNLLNSYNIEASAIKRHRFMSTCGNYVYHIAIIDFLTRFNFWKRLESYYKVNFKNNKKELVSCVPPELYASRFYNFLVKEVIINEKIAKEKELRLISWDIKDALFNKLITEFNDEYDSHMPYMPSIYKE